MTTTSRRAVLAGIATAPAVPASAVLALAEPDPIFAAIERYKTAVQARTIALQRCWGYSRSGPLRHLPIDAPECIEADELHNSALDGEIEALNDLLDTGPTTLAGFSALLDQLAVDPYYEDGADEALIIMALEQRPELLATLATRLRAIALKA